MREIYRNKFFELALGWNFSYQLTDHGEDWCIIISLIFITLYIPIPKKEFSHTDKSWGVYYHMRSFNFSFGEKLLWVRLPWDWEFVSHEVMKNDGTFVEWKEEYHEEVAKLEDNIYILKDEYRYVTKDGQFQRCNATVIVERRTWVWYWLKWLGYPKMVRQEIWVEFDKEMGERVDTWKGGIIGCGYQMLEGETPLHTLRRMEFERKL